MYKYKIQAYNSNDILSCIDEVILVVAANSEDDAISKARQIKDRQHYSVFEIEDLGPRELKKRV